MLSLLLSTILACGAVAENEIVINNMDEFLEFSENVNNGTNYKGTTVMLNTDLDFTGKTVDPIGLYHPKIFSGTFDGQGYTISNLVISSPSFESVGLFGFTQGNLKNIIIDETCSFSSTHESDNKAYVYVGSVAGSCLNCTIDNCINKGTVNFNGNIYSPNDKDNELFIGGIVGFISNHCTVEKCINYGNVTHTGKSYDVSMGGIVGDSGAFTSDVFVRDCTNYGEVALRGSIDSDYRIGGVIGRKSPETIVENCENFGPVSSASSIIVNIALLFFLLAILF